MNWVTSNIKKHKASNGFTLTEILVSVVIVSLVTITVYTSFKTVVMSYEKNDSAVRMIENARAALGDISITMKGIPAASLPTLVSYATNTEPIFTDSLDSAMFILAERGYSQDSVYFMANADVAYWYYVDTTSNELIKYNNGTAEPLAFGVLTVSFLLYGRDTSSNTWLPSWDSNDRGELPRSIFIALTLKDEKNRLIPHTYTTLVTLP